jgi:CO dehydrogenase maturation factor
MKIAISGKGGTGKTTLAALMCCFFAEMGRSVVAVDADPDANLAGALGFKSDIAITPLVEMKELIRERVGAAPGEPTVYFTMNPRVDDIPERFALRMGNIRLMVMGTIRRGGSGCACPESVMVKELIGHLLLGKDEIVIMDMEAGIEHLGRGTARFVDALIVVVQPTGASLQTCARIKKLAADLAIPRVLVVANKVTCAQEQARIEQETGGPVWGVIPASDSLLDYTGKSVDPAVAGEIARLCGALTRPAESIAAAQ